MKKKYTVLAVSLLMLSSASAAYSSTGMYISIHGGIAMLNDLDAQDQNNKVVTNTLESSAGFALTGALGYDFGPARLEAEVGYQGNDGDQVVDNNGNKFNVDDITTSATTVFLNGYLDFSNSSPVTPYISSGFGVLKFNLEEDNDSQDDTVLGFQAGAGVDIALNENVSLDLKYRYLASIGDVELDDGDVVVDQYSSHNIYGGLKFTF